jgi:hypothetical protein
MIRIFADFNNVDEQDRVRLNTVGSLADIKNYEGRLTEGMVVLLYTPGEFEVEGTLTFDRAWHAIPNYDTIHYYNPEDEI